jgi:hypothetical protein
VSLLEPFRIAVPDADLLDLRRRLSAAGVTRIRRSCLDSAVDCSLRALRIAPGSAPGKSRYSCPDRSAHSSSARRRAITLAPVIVEVGQKAVGRCGS